MFFFNLVITLSVATTQVLINAISSQCSEFLPARTNKTENSGFKGFNKLMEAMDEKFQNLVYTRIDPYIAGVSRDKYLEAVTNNSKREASSTENRANRRLAVSIFSIALLGLMVLTGPVLLPLLFVLIVYSVWPWYYRSYTCLVRERRLSIIHPVMFSDAWMWLSGHYVLGTFAYLFFNLFHKVRFITHVTARQNLVDIFDRHSPARVWINKDGIELEIAFEKLKLGDVLIVDAGMVIPVDGMIIEGFALVDQHRLTGEAQAVEKESGDSVLASSLMLAGRLWVRVEKSGEDTSAAKIVRVLENTVDDSGKDLLECLKDIEHTLWPFLFAGLFAWIIAGPTSGVAVLGANLIGCLIPLKMITLLNALNLASKHSILIKNGSALDRLGDIDTLVFDKTGTLTLEALELVRIHDFDNRSERDILMLAATAEYKQTHPVALSILKAAREQDIELSSTDATEYEIGYGIRVKINNARILVGSLRFMTLEQVLIPSCFQSRVEICHRDGISLVYIAENGRLVGALEFDACLRPEAKGVINWLKTSGIRLYIVSGDAEAPTRRLADELGMDAYFANILPDGKADIIKQLKSDGQKPGFIGDGINDAIALREADVSISFCSATQAASDNAAIILMNNDLRQLQTLFKLAWSFEKSVSVNYRTSLVMTLVAGAGAIVLPWKFLIVQSMFVVNYMIGFVVATRPLLDKSINTDKKPD